MATKTKGKKPEGTTNVDDLSAELNEALREEVAADLAKGPQFADSEAEAAPAPKGKKKREPEARAGRDEDSLAGKRVSFLVVGGATATGTVIKQIGEMLEVEEDDSKGQIWNVEVGSAEVLDEEAEDETPGDEVPEAEGEVEIEAPAPKAGKATDVTPAMKVADAALERYTDVRIVAIAEIKIPKAGSKPREVDRESERYKSIVASIKANGLNDPVLLTSWKKKTLVEGGHRIAAFEELGQKFIPCRVTRTPEELEELERILLGTEYNLARVEMSWVDQARVFSMAAKKGYEQKELAKRFGLNASEVNRMIAFDAAATKDLSGLRKHAREDSYSKGVFTELAEKPVAVQKKVLELMDSGAHVFVDTVRGIAKGEIDPDAIPRGAKTTQAATRTAAATYRDLSSKELHESIGIRVHGDSLEVHFRLPWTNKTFRNFELLKAIKAAIDDAFSAEGVTVDSHKALEDALTTARAGLKAD